MAGGFVREGPVMGGSGEVRGRWLFGRLWMSVSNGWERVGKM